MTWLVEQTLAEHQITGVVHLAGFKCAAIIVASGTMAAHALDWRMRHTLTEMVTSAWNARQVGTHRSGLNTRDGCPVSPDPERTALLAAAMQIPPRPTPAFELLPEEDNGRRTVEGS